MTRTTIHIGILVTLSLALPLLQTSSASATTGWVKAVGSKPPAWACTWNTNSTFRVARVNYNAYDSYNRFTRQYDPGDPASNFYRWYAPDYTEPSGWFTSVYMLWESVWNTLYPAIPEIGKCALKGGTTKDSGITFLHRRYFNIAVPAGKIIGQARLKRWSDNGSSWYINGTRLAMWGGGYPGDTAGKWDNPLYIDPTLLKPNSTNLLAVANYNDNQNDPNGNPLGIQYYLEYTLVDIPKTDIVMTTSVSPSTVAVAGDGSVNTWKLTVTNNSSVTAHDVVVTDYLPSGLMYNSASGAGWACEYQSSIRKLSCTRSSLAAWTSSTINFNFKVPANFRIATNPSNATVTNTASVTTSTPESNAANNADSASLTVVFRADVQVTKGDTVDPVWVGDQFRYNITIRNNGPSVARNKYVTDYLPDGLIYVSKYDPSGYCTYTQTTRRFSCHMTHLDVGSNVTVGIYVRVEGSFKGSSIINTAIAAGGTTDPNSTNNSDNEVTTINQRLDLRVSKSDTPDPVVAGNQLTWSLDVVNDGPSEAVNVSIVDTLPPGIELQSRTVNRSGWSCVNDGSTSVSCSGPSLAAGQSVHVTIVARVKSNHLSSSLNNCTEVSNAIRDINLSNNSDCETTTLRQRADLSLVKIADPDPVMPGDPLYYTLNVNNAGPSDAYKLVVRDQIPAPPSGSSSLVFVAATGSGWSCSYAQAAHEVTCMRSHLAAGATAPPIRIELLVPEDFESGTVITNAACVTSDTTDPAPANNCDEEDVKVNHVVVVNPPSGYFFAHVRQNGDIDPSGTQTDYLAHEYIAGHLQVPMGIGFGYQTETAPLLCLSNRRPCPPGQSVYGHVLLNHFRITAINEMDSESAPLWTGDILVEMNRYATSRPTECGGPSAPSERCVAKDLHSDTYAWRDPGEYVFLGFYLDVGDEPIQHPTCANGFTCVFVDDVMPGYYEIRGAASLTVVFPGYPEFDQYYVDMPVAAHVRQAAPHILPSN